MATPSLIDLVRNQEAAYLDTLEALVRLESPSRDVARANRLADHLERLLADDDWTVTRTPATGVGDRLLARRGGGDGPATLLLCHYDTVWPPGSLDVMPWRREGDAVYGPGTLDMKAGIATAVHALRLVAPAGRSLRGPVTLLLTSDEETGSHASRDAIEVLAREHDRVLVLEPGREDGAVKVGRKGVGQVRATFTGRSAHAGNNPAEGASALRELAHFLLYVEDLGDEERGTTVNLTVAAGGTTGNVIAERATADVDLRVATLAEAERVERAVHGYRPRDPRVEVAIAGGLNRPPLERTEGNEALWEEAQRAGSSLGLALIGAVVGGGSDGSFTSALGVPTLDGLGSVGAGPHARHEHIRVRETLERVALLCALLTEA